MQMRQFAGKMRKGRYEHGTLHYDQYLTDEGRKTIKKNPERILEVNKEIENMGAKVHANMPFWDHMISSM